MNTRVNTTVLLALRERAKWSQEDLAEAAGVSPRTVQRLESGAAASSESVMAVAAALEVRSSLLSTQEPSGKTLRAGFTEHEVRRERSACIVFTTLGYLCSSAGISYSMWIGHTPARYAGMSIGLLGAICGGFLFVMGRYYERKLARADLDNDRSPASAIAQ